MDGKSITIGEMQTEGVKSLEQGVRFLSPITELEDIIKIVEIIHAEVNGYWEQYCIENNITVKTEDEIGGKN